MSSLVNKPWLTIGTLAASLVFAPASLQAQPAPSDASRSASLTSEERSRVTFDAYILGPGDGLEIELLDLPELSGRFTIGPDGTIYLPDYRHFQQVDSKKLHIKKKVVQKQTDFFCEFVMYSHQL